jgi:hypothetical protein
MSVPEGPFTAVSVALSRELAHWPAGPPAGATVRIHPALWNEIRADERAGWRARRDDGEFLPSLDRWFGLPVDVTADVIPGHLAELTVPHPDDPGQFAAHCLLPSNADVPGAAVYAVWPLGPPGEPGVNLAAAFPPPTCHCLCGVAHPAEDAACDALHPVTARRLAGRDVPMCGPCAAARDRRQPADCPLGEAHGAALYPIPPAPADPGGLYESQARGLWQDPGPLETARQVYQQHLDVLTGAMAGESGVNLEAAMRYLRATYGRAEADAAARVEDTVDLGELARDPDSAAAAVGRVYNATLEVARELLRRQLGAAIQVLALYGVPVGDLAALLNGATELGGAVTDLDALPGDVAVTVAAGPGRIPEIWLHAAPGVWVGPAGADPVAEDLTAEQVTAAQARELAAAAWKRAGRDVG